MKSGADAQSSSESELLTRQIETSTEDDEAECGPVEGLLDTGG